MMSAGQPVTTSRTHEMAAVPQGYKRSNAGLIPQDWRVSTIGAEFRIQLGKMVDAAKNSGVPKPYLGNRSVQWGRIDVENIDTVPMTRADLQRFRLRQGDLLVCEGGEIGRAAIWDNPIPECYYQKALHRLRSRGGYDVYLMKSLLELWASTGYLANYVTQTSIAHLPTDKLEIVPVPVPSRHEQRAIVAVLSDADRLLESLDIVIAKKRSIKQAAMQQLLTGNVRLPGFHGKWKTKSLGEIGNFLKGRGIKRDDVSHEGYRCIRYGELYTRYEDHVSSLASRVPQTVAMEALPISTGDLLFAASGETPDEIGRCVAYLGREQAYAGGDIIVWTLHRQNPVFLGYLMNHPRVAKQKARMGQGDAVVHVSVRNLAQVQIELPPMPEQDAIAAILSDTDAEIAALELRRRKIRTIKQGMMQQLLTGRVRLVRHDDLVAPRKAP